MPVERYLVTYGKYKYYSFTKANCATFIRDFLSEIVYGFKSKAKLLGGNKFICTPDILYSVARMVGEEI